MMSRTADSSARDLPAVNGEGAGEPVDSDPVVPMVSAN
jgi:hypothetical protein